MVPRPRVLPIRLLGPALSVLASVVAAGCEPVPRTWHDAGSDGLDAGAQPLDAEADAAADPEAGRIANFLMLDVNSASPTFGQLVSPRHYLGKISAWFFGHSTCSWCRDQFVALDQMQQEIAEEDLTLEVQILGVNQMGYEAEDDLMCEGVDLPWLREGRDHDVWEEWGVSYPIVAVLDTNNEPVYVFNVLEWHLDVRINYEALRQLLINQAR